MRLAYVLEKPVPFRMKNIDKKKNKTITLMSVLKSCPLFSEVSAAEVLYKLAKVIP